MRKINEKKVIKEIAKYPNVIRWCITQDENIRNGNKYIAEIEIYKSEYSTLLFQQGQYETEVLDYGLSNGSPTSNTAEYETSNIPDAKKKINEIIKKILAFWKTEKKDIEKNIINEYQYIEVEEKDLDL